MCLIEPGCRANHLTTHKLNNKFRSSSKSYMILNINIIYDFTFVKGVGDKFRKENIYVMLYNKEQV